MKQILFTLIRLGIGTAEATDEECTVLLNLKMKQWRNMMALAEKKGVAAVVFDGIQKLFAFQQIGAVQENPKEWTQWVFKCAGMMTQYERMNKQQKDVIRSMSGILYAEGIRMMVFKGQANASLYPIPEHRPVGDIDCWLFGDAEKGDIMIEKHGAVVDFNWYRHSKIYFQGETIENHRVMAHTRGNRKMKEMEEELEAMLNHSELKEIDECSTALMPPPLFNACFLTYHALHHFISEGLGMKQIIDWAMFVQKEHDKVDWLQFCDFCLRYKLDRFAAVMNYIATKHLGVKCNINDFENLSSYDVKSLAEKVINSTLCDDEYVFNSGKADWIVRWILIKNMFTRDRWKYRDIAQQNVFVFLWHRVKGFLIEKD
jgi:hypothetical protein